MPEPIFAWQPDTPAHDAVFEALGAASSCWSHLDQAGTFDVGRCAAIGEELMAFLRSKLWVDG